MIISLRIENFRSFWKEQEFSLVADERVQEHADHLAAIPGHEAKLVPVAAIFGANGSGKSNFVKALSFLRQQVVEDRESPALPRDPFRLAAGTPGQPTKIVLQFQTQGHVFEYGVHVGDYVEQEWLSVLGGTTAQPPLFERATKPDGTSERTAAGLDTHPDQGRFPKPRDFVTRIGPTPGKTLLRSLSESIGLQERGPLLDSVDNFFRHQLTLVYPASAPRLLSALIAGNHDFRRHAEIQLAKAGSGISGLAISEEVVSLEQFARDNPSLLRELRALPVGHRGNYAHVDGTQVVGQIHPDGKIGLLRISAEHRGSEGRASFLWSDESDGTRRLLQLLALHHMARLGPRTIVVDEINNSLHALVCKEFISGFLAANAAGERRSQLIFTTHDTSLMDLRLLRRDEIRFVEKDAATQASAVFSLADFKPRVQPTVQQAYLEGRYGAVPAGLAATPEAVEALMQALANDRPRAVAEKQS